MKIEIFDSTLRDGAQGKGICFSLQDKMKILKRLDNFGVTYIEAGNPASNPKDMEFFNEAAKYGLKKSRLVAFGSTRRKDITAAEDEGIESLLKSGTKYVTIFGKSWDMHVDCILGTTLEENLNMIYDSINYLASKGKTVFFDAEHFFDGYKENPEYAVKTLKTAQKAGADTVVLCDTNGGTFPDEIAKIVKTVNKEISIKIAIHCHNDCGCAVANSLSAVKAGATQVQGTFVGIGERCGNTNLSTIIADLQLKMGYRTVSDESLSQLTPTARYIAEVANIKLLNSMPYVGSSAFAHKGGMHADGVEKNPRTFEHVSPDSVGNKRNFLLSEVSGRSAVLLKLKEFDNTLDKDSEETKRIINKLKELELMGFQFEAAQASFEILMLKELGLFTPFFKIEDYKIVVSGEDENSASLAGALIKVNVGNRYEITADEGEGPVNAIDKALRKALEVFYPVLSRMHLVDYKVRVINGSTAAITRVLIESSDGENTWTTVGASNDIINASMTALVDSLEYMLLKSGEYNYFK